MKFVDIRDSRFYSKKHNRSFPDIMTKIPVSDTILRLDQIMIRILKSQSEMFDFLLFQICKKLSPSQG